MTQTGGHRFGRPPMFWVMSKISQEHVNVSSQDDFGQGPACSALAMNPNQMEVMGARPPCLQELQRKGPWPLLSMLVLDPNHPD